MARRSQAEIDAAQGDLENGRISQEQYNDYIYGNETGSKYGSARSNPDYVYTSKNGGSTSSSSTSSNSSQTTTNTSNGSSTGVSYTDMPGVRRNPDGTANVSDLQALKDAQAAQIRSAYLTDALGVNREKTRADRAKEALENQKRAKVSAWTDSARVLSDIISAGIGGNVYRREKDNTAKEMHERNVALRELQAAEDAQAALQDWQANRDAALAILQNGQRIDQMAGVNRSTNTNNQTNTSTTTSNSKSSTSQSNSGSTNTSYYDESEEYKKRKKEEAKKAAEDQAAQQAAQQNVSQMVNDAWNITGVNQEAPYLNNGGKKASWL